MSTPPPASWFGRCPALRPRCSSSVRSAFGSNRWPRLLAVLFLASLTPPTLATAEDLDEQQLQRASVATDTKSLLDFLHQLSADKPDPAKVPQFVSRLGAKEFNTREEASKALNAIGLLALPPLWEATKIEDAEVQRRARAGIKEINGQPRWELHLPTVRLIVKRRPPEAVAALLQYLPYAAQDEIIEEIWYGLDDLAVKDGKLDARVVEALRDPFPARRAVAACIVARRGTPEQRAAARQLLTDRSVEVRLRAAQGMLAAGEKDVLPVLVPLLEEASIDLAWQAEELLHWAAEKTSPKVVLGAGSPEERKRCRQAWERWWQAGPAVDLRNRAGAPGPGLVLVTYCPPPRPILPGDPEYPRRVGLYGRDGTVRWQSVDFLNLAAAQLLPGGRLLLAQGPEQFEGDKPPFRPVRKPSKGVNERDLSGQILWQAKGKLVQYEVPKWCERLPNGNTRFASTPLRVSEVAPDGEVVAEYHYIAIPDLSGDRPQGTKYGTLFCRTNVGGKEALEEFDFLDPQTVKRTAKIPLPKDCYNWPYYVEPLLGGNYLIAIPHREKIQEFDRTGAVVWECRGTIAGHATRLRGGITLAGVGRRMGLEESLVREFDRQGKVVWQATVPGYGSRARAVSTLIRFGFPTEAGQ